MGARALRYYILGGLILLVIGAGGAFFYAFETALPNIEPVIAPKPVAPSEPIAPSEPAKPEISIWIKDKRTLVVEWRNLPSLTSRIDIFRGKGGKTLLSFWKSFGVADTNLASGSREITVPIGDAPTSYFYYLTSIAENGSSLWTSTTTVPTTVPPVFIFPPVTTPPPIVIILPTSTTPTPTSTTPIVIAPTSTIPTSTTPEATSTVPTPTSTLPIPTSSNPFSYPPGSILFYSPSGEITGYIVPSTYTFWAQYVDNKIELNWQNIPTGTDSLHVFRSVTSTDTWVSLLIQYNPPIGVPGSIKIVDETVTQPFYYRMEARQGTQTLGIYGPVFLPGL